MYPSTLSRATKWHSRYFKLARPLSPCSFRRFTSPACSALPGLRSPTVDDAKEFLRRMNHRVGSVITDDEILKTHNQDWSNKWTGQSRIMLRPKSTEEVASILQYCNENRIGVVPQAGNTGLVGGSVPMADEVIVSVRGMNQMEGLDVATGILKCDAGCVLQDLQTYAAAYDYMIPVDIGAKGSCCIGGNVSTSAGGQYFRRYGSMHANVLGLEVALPDGRTLDMMQSVNLKDNTGYDLKHLFIGAEGTLGIVTRVALLCPPMPKARHAAFVACDDFQAVQSLLRLAKDMLGEVLAAFEYMDRKALDLVKEHIKIPVVSGDSSNYPYCVLIETHGSNEEHNIAKMEAFLGEAMERETIAGGILSQDQSQVLEMWEVRDYAGPAVSQAGYIYKYDISIPVSEFENMSNEVYERLKGQTTKFVVANWGHIMDGNQHLNIVTPGLFEPSAVLIAQLEPFIFESVVRRGGSISAEHGLGQCKNDYLPICKDETAVNLMSSIKRMLDVNGIMNPGKFLPTN